MNAVIYLNKTMVEAAKARLPPLSHSILDGRGVFTIVAIHHGKPFLWAKHWSRLVDHAGKLRLDLTGIEEKAVTEALQKLLAVNHVNHGTARVVLLARDGRDFSNRKLSAFSKTDLLIMTADAQNSRAEGLTLAVSPYRYSASSSLAGIKSLNYLEHILSLEEAQSRDFDEALMLNERGEIVSATMANLFWVKEGTVHTPALSTGAIAGVTREAVIELARKQFTPVVEGVYEILNLTEADEIFLTSSSLGVRVVTTFDFRQYSIAAGSVAIRLKAAYEDLKSRNSAT